MVFVGGTPGWSTNTQSDSARAKKVRGEAAHLRDLRACAVHQELDQLAEMRPDLVLDAIPIRVPR
jgi:hypothetical protein